MVFTSWWTSYTDHPLWVAHFPESELSGNILRLAVRCTLYASATATATGSMHVYATATSTGWVTIRFYWYIKGYVVSVPALPYGFADAWVTVKFIITDLTAGTSTEWTLLNTRSHIPEQWRLDTINFPLYNLHHYIFSLNAEASAWAIGMTGGMADVGGDIEPDNRIEWGYLEVPNTIPYYPGGGGGCPYLSTWNGTHYVLDNNLLPAAEYSNGTDVIDYYLLQQPLVRNHGKYSLLIWDLDKHSYLDYVRLLAVDHASDVNVAVSPYGEILTYKNPLQPLSVFNSQGDNILSLLIAQDGTYYEGYKDDYIILDFSGVDISKGAKLVIRDPIDCDLTPCLKSPVPVQVMDSSGAWQTVATFYTRLYWTTDIIDLKSYLPDANGEIKIRISFTSNSKIDYVGLDTTEQGEFETFYANLVSAVHATQGNVKEMLERSDDLYAELQPNQQITLQFTLPQKTKEKRDFIIILEGRYKTAP